MLLTIALGIFALLSFCLYLWERRDRMRAESREYLNSNMADSLFIAEVCKEVGLPVTLAKPAFLEFIRKLNYDSIHAQLISANKTSEVNELEAACEVAESRLDQATILFEYMLKDNRLIADAREAVTLEKRITEWLEYHP